VVINFIGGGNRSTLRKPPAATLSHNVVLSTPRLNVSGDRHWMHG